MRLRKSDFNENILAICSKDLRLYMENNTIVLCVRDSESNRDFGFVYYYSVYSPFFASL